MSNSPLSNQLGRLYIVATPIGNMDDITHRALKVLAEADSIAAEDTRHSRLLLQRHGISTSTIALHQHNEMERGRQLVQRMAQGERIALISDAGTPAIRDPGYKLVRMAQDNGITVVPIPGASALVAALSASGMECEQFIFAGFLQAKKEQRNKQLQQLCDETKAIVFYESSHRIVDMLQAVVEVFGSEREAVVAREITKKFETIKRATVAELYQFISSDTNQQRGEFVLIVAGNTIQNDLLDSKTMQIARILAQELPSKQAARLTSQISGCSQRDIYQYLIQATE